MKEAIMEARTITTHAATLHIAPPSAEVLRALAIWPKGIRQLQTPDGTAWCVVLADEKGELPGLRVNYGYYSEEADAFHMLQIQRVLLPAAIPDYLECAFDGILLPCAYLVGTSPTSFFTGYVLFGRSLGHREAGIKCEPFAGYEDLFGVGGTNMFLSFLASARKTWNAVGLPERTVSDLDIEPRSSCGRVHFDFLVAGADVIYVNRKIREDDPIWPPNKGLQPAAAGVIMSRRG
jgi:hypothetical protein